MIRLIITTDGIQLVILETKVTKQEVLALHGSRKCRSTNGKQYWGHVPNAYEASMFDQNPPIP